MNALVDGAGGLDEGPDATRCSTVFDRLDDLLARIDGVATSIRGLGCARRAVEQPHRPALCALVRPDGGDDPLTAGGGQAACRACLT